MVAEDVDGVGVGEGGGHRWQPRSRRCRRSLLDTPREYGTTGCDRREGKGTLGDSGRPSGRG